MWHLCRSPLTERFRRGRAGEEKIMTNTLTNASAPDFTLADQEGNVVALSSFKSQRPVLLVFYPGDDTLGCTKQLCAIRDDWSEFQKYNVGVYGVNPADADSHTKFWRHHGLKTPLLVDTDKRVAKLYDATKKFFKTEIVNRTVVLIDRMGIIRGYWRGMPSTETILAAVKALV